MVIPFPESETTLPRNGQIILISVNGKDERLPQMGTRGVALVAKGHRVPLKVVETHDDPDGYGEAAAVLKPTRRLRPGLTYELRWAAREDYPFSWQVSRKKDRRAPAWRARPVHEIAQKDGPGYQGSPLVRIHASDGHGPLAIRATLQVGSVKRTAIWDFQHEECAFTGYLAANLKGPARLQMTLLDTAGNRSEKTHTVTLPGDLSAYLCPESPPAASP